MPRLHDNHGLLDYGDGRIQNNAWGFDGERPPQSISTPPGEVAGWQWNWPGHDDSRVMAYPEVIHGKKPWLAASTTTQLPARVEDIASIRIAYVIDTRARGVYNAAFELWLCASAQATPEQISTEIMIWVDKHGLQPAGTCVQRYDTPWGLADLFDCRMQHWRYLAFVLREPMNAGVIELRWFVDVLLDAGLIDAEHFVASVEFGNEIAYGRGSTTIERYSLQLVTR